MKLSKKDIIFKRAIASCDIENKYGISVQLKNDLIATVCFDEEEMYITAPKYWYVTTFIFPPNNNGIRKFKDYVKNKKYKLIVDGRAESYLDLSDEEKKKSPFYLSKEQEKSNKECINEYYKSYIKEGKTNTLF